VNLGGESKVRDDRSPLVCVETFNKKLSEAASCAATVPKSCGDRGLRTVSIVVVLG